MTPRASDLAVAQACRVIEAARDLRSSGRPAARRGPIVAGALEEARAVLHAACTGASDHSSLASVVTLLDRYITESDAYITESDAYITESDAYVTESDAYVTESDAYATESDAYATESDAASSSAPEPEPEDRPGEV